MAPLVPRAGAPRREIKGVLCGKIDFSLWASEKVALVPWGFVDAFNPVEEVHRRENFPFLFLVCRGSCGCEQVWDVPEKGLGSIQSNIVRHVNAHFPTTLVAGGEGAKSAKVKDSPTQHEFVAHWLASGLPHYQVTRAAPSGLYNFLQSRTNCPVSSKPTFDKHCDLFLESTVDNMQDTLHRRVGFIVGDSTPDRMKREWINFGVTSIDTDSLEFEYLPSAVSLPVQAEKWWHTPCRAATCEQGAPVGPVCRPDDLCQEEDGPNPRKQPYAHA
jgi:hypothetical protein